MLAGDARPSMAGGSMCVPSPHLCMTSGHGDPRDMRSGAWPCAHDHYLLLSCNTMSDDDGSGAQQRA
jgi:hypothetical protein